MAVQCGRGGVHTARTVVYTARTGVPPGWLLGDRSNLDRVHDRDECLPDRSVHSFSPIEEGLLHRECCGIGAAAETGDDLLDHDGLELLFFSDAAVQLEEGRC